MNQHKLILCVVAMAWTTTVAADLPGEDLARNIREIVPEGWTCHVISEKGQMGHPHGLGEPTFRIDFINDTIHWQFPDGNTAESSPSLRLHFHGIEHKAEILKSIEDEQIFSWDIPIYFAETKDYLVITSPPWVNGGHYSEEAKRSVKPLEKALKDFFRGKKEELSNQALEGTR